MEPGVDQTLEVTVYNSSDEEITVNVNNTIATTNSNGLIVYDGLEEGQKPHESMENPFSDISEIDNNKITVPAGGQEIVKVKVNAPEESFDGVILGGLYFTLEPDENEDEGSVAIQNRYSYALAVQIREADNETEVKPDISLLSVEPGIVNYRTGLQTEFVNTTPMIIGGLTFEGSVFEENGEEAIYTHTVEDFVIAPNSQFNFPVMYENHRLEAGTYTFKATVSNEDNDWDFEQQFEVTDEMADEANEAAVELAEDENSWLIYAVAGLALTVVLLLVILVIVLKRKK